MNASSPDRDDDSDNVVAISLYQRDRMVAPRFENEVQRINRLALARVRYRHEAGDPLLPLAHRSVSRRTTCVVGALLVALSCLTVIVAY